MSAFESAASWCISALPPIKCHKELLGFQSHCTKEGLVIAEDAMHQLPRWDCRMCNLNCSQLIVLLHLRPQRSNCPLNYGCNR
jgi:hypothetical protein